MDDYKNLKKNNQSLKKNKQRTNYKKKWEDAKKEIMQLELKILEQKKENEINILAFQKKAQGFSKKAQEEINVIRKNLESKLEIEKSNLKKYCSQNLLESIVEPLINIDIAIKSGKTNEYVLPYVTGLEMLLNQIYKEFEQFGIFKISPLLNVKFDHKMHHAVEKIKGPKDSVIEIKKEGFRLYDRVLKPAIVVIGE